MKKNTLRDLGTPKYEWRRNQYAIDIYDSFDHPIAEQKMVFGENPHIIDKEYIILYYM